VRIGIHNRKGSFSKRWIDYCIQQQIEYKIVDCYQPDILDQLEECEALMWHFTQDKYQDMLFARQLILSIETAGKKVFPNSNTCWHFDDKVGQKYLLEAVKAPLVTTWVFYTQKEALIWANNTTFPKVFKLRCGAGSSNVELVKSSQHAKKIIRKGFGKGFSQFNRYVNLKERFRKFGEGKDDITGLVKGLLRLFIPTELALLRSPEKGYVYFQEFIPDNDHDLRVVVIGDKAFAIKRMTRKDDFRASGSGNIIYSRESIDLNLLKIAFDTTHKLNAQCLAFDFIFIKKIPLIIEISFGFSQRGYEKCPGYWDSDLLWHEGHFNPQEWMVEMVLNKS
jgi:glutathione synthase/RimK-type ligase-like ATP-grasp enzyme